MVDYSIITVNFNDKEGLRKTIDSVLQQDYNNYEFIIIDGGSTDGSKELIEDNENKISYWCSEPDSGIFNAMNKGITHAKGEYLLFLNGGDIFHDNNVLKNVKKELDGTDIIAGYALKDGKSYLNFRSSNVFMLFLYSSFSHQATFIRRGLFNNYKYDESCTIIADWTAWIDWIILENRSYKYIDTIISDYDFSGISSDPANWDKILEQRKYVLTTRFSPLMYDHLMKSREFYLRSHYKYIEFHPLLKRLSWQVLKPIALIGKFLDKINR